MKNFWPKLQQHLLSRIHQRRTNNTDEWLAYTQEECNHIQIIDNTFFAVKTLRINYTTYDIRRDYDVINPRTDHRDIMVYAPAEGEDLYWYARVLGVFHARVVHLDRSEGSTQPVTMEFLWVRWFERVQNRANRSISKLPKVAFVDGDIEDSGAFGFVDPSLVIRACHLIPDFEAGRTNTLLSTRTLTAARTPEENDDWCRFYVMM